jgi:hypothetical protein
MNGKTSKERSKSEGELYARSPSKGAFYGFSIGAVFLGLCFFSHPMSPELAFGFISLSFGFGFLGVAFSCRHPVIGFLGLIIITTVGAYISNVIFTCFRPRPLVFGWIIGGVLSFAGIGMVMSGKPVGLTIGVAAGIIAIFLRQGVSVIVAALLIPSDLQGNSRIPLAEANMCFLYSPIMTLIVWLMERVMKRHVGCSTTRKGAANDLYKQDIC